MIRYLSISGLLLIALLLPQPTSATETSPNSTLIGTWRLKTFKQFADGKLVRTQDSSDGTTMQFMVDGTWALSSPRFKSSGTYRWLDDKKIETKIIQSNIPAQIGFMKAKQIRVNSQELELTVIYDEVEMQTFPARADGTRPKEMVTISTCERVAGK